MMSRTLGRDHPSAALRAPGLSVQPSSYQLMSCLGPDADVLHMQIQLTKESPTSVLLLRQRVICNTMDIRIREIKPFAPWQSAFAGDAPSKARFSRSKIHKTKTPECGLLWGDQDRARTPVLYPQAVVDPTTCTVRARPKGDLSGTRGFQERVLSRRPSNRRNHTSTPLHNTTNTLHTQWQTGNPPTP